jgi:Zn-dependent protease
MLRPLRIAQAFGIPIYIHWTFFLLPLWVIASNMNGPTQELAMNLAVLTAGFGCVVLHELGHALTARYYGIGTRDITLYPIGGVASLDRMSEKPSEEFWIAIAGPAVNVVIAGLLVVGLIAGALLGLHQMVPDYISQFFVILMAVNISLVVFNAIPAFPMDGGRVLRSLLAMHISRLRATRIAVRVGAVMAILMGLGGFALMLTGASPMLPVIAFFIFMAGQRELQVLEERERLREEPPLPVLPVLPARPVMVTPAVTVPLSGLLLRPKVSVYTWDEQSGAWVPDSAAPSPRSWPGR